MVGRVAVAADRHVPAGHHELELLAARLAEDGDAVLLAIAAGVIGELLVDPLVPLGADDPLEDLADDRLLVLGVKVGVVDVVLGDVPVGGDARPQQAALGVHVIPRETNLLTLAGRERLEQHLHERFGRR